MNKNNNNSQYIEGNSRVRIALFAFLGIWAIVGFLLKTFAEKKIEQINTAKNATAALTELNNIFINFLIIPLSIFCTIQGLYFLWLGAKTMRVSVYPPPDVKMPFRTKIQTGTTAKIYAIACLFAGVCNFTVIALLLLMKYGIFKYI